MKPAPRRHFSICFRGTHSIWSSSSVISYGLAVVVTLGLWAIALAPAARAEAGDAGTISGTVTDPSGAVVRGATVTIDDPVSQYQRMVSSDSSGRFVFTNVPFNPYHMTVVAKGFAAYVHDIAVRSSVPLSLDISLKISVGTQTVTVTAQSNDLIEKTPTNHTDIDRAMFSKLPLESQTSSLSSLVTLASPGIAADSNGLFHGMGNHASNSFSVDGQPITDQQSKVFSNQIPVSAVQSMEVIPGAPPAEYGDKTSVVIVVNTRSGQGMTTPHGDVTASYGAFGTTNDGFNLGYGGQKWGNFISVNGLNTSRFFDPPEFTAMHDKGNEENVFDRIDYQFSTKDTAHLNLEYTRSWFQNPNSYDQELHLGLVNPLTGAPLGPTDQRSQIKTLNVAPSWTHLINSDTVFALNGWVRQDQYNYYPSGDPFNDYSPDLQSETFGQSRKLTNMGGKADVNYVKGINSVKAGVQYVQTFLTEGDQLSIVDPGLVPSLGCQAANGISIPGTPCAILAPYDLATRGGYFTFHGHTDIKELALYGLDQISKGNWSANLGFRADLYNGLSIGRQAEPRLGVAYNIKPSNTVLRVSYARTLESPFNENLIISSEGCSHPFLAALVPPPGVPCPVQPIQPGWSNQFHAGLEQALGKHVVVDWEYVWDYYHNAFDFGVVGNTPLTFPIEWSHAKIPGWDGRLTFTNFHGFSAFVVASSVAARFFLPQVAGLPIVPASTGVFRIDHDEFLNATTHLEYQPWRRGPWFGFNWRYDSGLVAGSTPCYNASTATCAPTSTTLNGQPAVNLLNTVTGTPLTADQQAQAGLTCNGVAATLTSPLPSPCLASQFGSALLYIPAPGTENDDHNPQRVKPRSLFDLSVGDDNLFHGDKYKWSLRLDAINLTNKVALYNWLSTFSGTHYVTPRTVTVTLGFHF
ncbi:MAG: carboxypeptidase regulatory-like domain-containing protein [Terriglobia bacterium]